MQSNLKPSPPSKPILVAGLGRAGDAALELLSNTVGLDGIFAWDASRSPGTERAAKRWRTKGAQVSIGNDGTKIIERLAPGSTIVKSPGIDPMVRALVQARDVGMNVIDELELAWRYTERPIVAVTGTNGKSTTCKLISSILRCANFKSEVVGNTEFGAPLSAASRESTFLVCEVSSFQLEASTSFLPDYAVFTNLTPEHLTRHGTMDHYGSIKKRMFVRDDRHCGTGIINCDDALGSELRSQLLAIGGKCISYGFSEHADVRITTCEWDATRARIVLAMGGRDYTFRTRLPGHHNALNIAAAFAFGIAADLDLMAIQLGIETTDGPPGRWQVIDGSPGYDVIVDYAHTPDGLDKVLSAAKEIVSKRGTKLHAVFGPVGLVDHEKAEGCAQAIAKWSDHLVLTTGSTPYCARIPRILELLRVIRARQTPVDVVLARSAAIKFAIRSGQPGDIVMILGIGALRRLIIDASGTIEACNDALTAELAIRGGH